MKGFCSMNLILRGLVGHATPIGHEQFAKVYYLPNALNCIIKLLLAYRSVRTTEMTCPSLLNSTDCCAEGHCIRF